MFKIRTIRLIVVFFILLLFWLVSFQTNEWFCETMPRHQLLQIPIMLGLGLIFGFTFFNNLKISNSWSLSFLIITVASFIFWMLPYSIDLSVIDSSFNRIMHINMLMVGAILVPALKNVLFEIKIIFLGMMAAMLTAVGFTLSNFKILLCSSFNIYQQNYTGKKLMIIGAVLFLFTVVKFFRESPKRTD